MEIIVGTHLAPGSGKRIPIPYAARYNARMIKKLNKPTFGYLISGMVLGFAVGSTIFKQTNNVDFVIIGGIVGVLFGALLKRAERHLRSSFR